MKTYNHIVTNANMAVARIAYKTNEVFPIYPITPTTEMAEAVEQWQSTGNKNSLGTPTTVSQMQSEAGVAGTMHGALQAGSLSTTFTSSQGLLLMIPNMYRIAGELLPNVIHVASRSIATHALSIFSDHTDVMAVRHSGYAILGSCSVQEAQDMALISQAASLASRIPFVHFFDGFRTSHEINCIEQIEEETIKILLDKKDILTFKQRGFNNDFPKIMGTAQGPSTFFESSEATNPYYAQCAEKVALKMQLFKELTGRKYKLFEYFGANDAEHLIIAMGSSINTIKQCIKDNSNKKWGCINVRLFRPFDIKTFLTELPKSCKSITVLDRCKDPASLGEPLYMDICTAMDQLKVQLKNKPKIIAGRYGLSSKEFTVNMVSSVFKNAEKTSHKHSFSLGIIDDVTHKSLEFETSPAHRFENEVLIEDVDKTVIHSTARFGDLIHHGKFIQLYREFDYSKVESKSIYNLRTHHTPIEAPYLIDSANLLITSSLDFCDNWKVMDRVQDAGTIIYIKKKNNPSIAIDFNLFKKLKSRKIRVYQYIIDEAVDFQLAIADFVNLWSETSKIEKIDNLKYGTLSPANIENAANTTLPNTFESFKVSDANLAGVFSARDYQEGKNYYSDNFLSKTYSTGAYFSMLTSLYGDRLSIANATGESSIVNGNIDNLPWYKDKFGRGTIWTNSLFEDNAEFGYGIHLSLQQKKSVALNTIKQLSTYLSDKLVLKLLSNKQRNKEEVELQRRWITEAKNQLISFNDPKISNASKNLDNLLNKVLWIVGGDGWAYDIGYGGLDHILASGENLNIMVFDNESYANTGGQKSKASRKGVKLGMSFKGKQTRKKKLLEMAACYPGIYVASIAIGANYQQCMEAITKAEQHPGPSLILACSVNEYKHINNDYEQAQTMMLDDGKWEVYEHISNQEVAQKNLKKMKVLNLA